MQARAPPSEQAEMLRRPPSSPIIAIENPLPSAPSRLATGTRQSSKITIAVGWVFQPSFRSFLPNDRPGVPFSMTMQEMPPALVLLGPGSPVRTIATYKSLDPPPEMNAL